MRKLNFNADQPLRILACGAHCDDIEIGCGGTLLRLVEECRIEKIVWVVFSSSEAREKEARACAEAVLRGVDDKTIVIKRFRNGFFPYLGMEIKEFVETLKSVEPNLIFTHYLHDRHQDHRSVAELCWNTFRDHLILEYEVPKYDGDLGNPNLFVPLGERDKDRKVEYLMRYFESQQHRPWFSPDTFDGLMRIRGVESNSDSGFAEAFYARKLVI